MRVLLYAAAMVFTIVLMPLASLAGDTNATQLGTVTVTGTREEEKLAETPSTVGVISEKEIGLVKPVHPSEIARTVPGVHVNITSGEGHMTAIRQPLTTSPVYLYLEDGIPSRSTGFFNHNALYELDVPQAGRIEITKGPGTALYGSDAIGGVINVITKAAPLTPELKATVEAGSFGWYRLLADAGGTFGDNGLRADVNLTHTDGWRDSTEYDRQSAVLRWDTALGSGATLKTVLSASNIDQTTAGASAVSRDDYLNNSRTNYTPISFRDVQAMRLSAAWEKEGTDTLVSVIPYLRYNHMELLPNWSLSYDPQVYTTDNRSIGLLIKCRKDFPYMRTRVVTGVDFDYSPGSYYERRITASKTGKVYTAYSLQELNYDYDVAYTGVSPYVHAETSPTEKLRVKAGLRYDHMGYGYDNNLSVVTTGSHRRAASTNVSFDHLSPKIGATYQFTDDFSGFVSYRHAFRVPSEGQLFRQGQAESTVDLKPIKANSFETGIRGAVKGRIDYEVSVYYMRIKDDIVSFTNTVDATRETTNAGETLHRGVEVGIGLGLTDDLNLSASYSYAKHTFEEWSPKTGVDLGGNEMSSAPRQIASTRLVYSPGFLNGGAAQIEWVHLGNYWMDDDNTHKYGGYDLANLLVDYKLGGWEIYAKALNLTDRRYASRSNYTQFRGEEFAPGMPLTVYAGLTYKFL